MSLLIAYVNYEIMNINLLSKHRAKQKRTKEILISRFITSWFSACPISDNTETVLN